MITEQRVMATLADSNPVPDVEQLDLVQLGTATYLANLERRSSEVTRLETKAEAATKRRNRGLIVVLAATVAVILGVVVVLLRNDSQTVVDEPVVTTVAEDAITTVPGDATSDEALLAARTEFLTRFAEASNSGDVTGALTMFNRGSFPPEIKRHPYGFGTFWDTAQVRNGLELTVAAQGSGSGIEFFDIEVSDGSNSSVPDISFSWRFDYGADGSESGGEAGCIGGKNGKIFLLNGLITSFDWGFEDPTKCTR